MRGIAESVRLDELLRVLHEGCPPVVVPDTGDHAGRPSGAFDLGGRGRDNAYGFFAEYVLAGSSRGLHNLLVEAVRGGDINDVDVVATDQFAPIAGTGLVAKVVNGQRSSLVDVLSDAHQLWHDLLVRKVHRE